MALPNNTTISISQIQSELADATYSLRALSASANKGTPDSMSEFWGYSDFYTIDMLILAGGGGGGRGASFQGGGGGGAGGFSKAFGYSVRKGTTISVSIGGGGGGGGNSSPGHGGYGGNSVVQGSFGTITVYGGGYGGGYTLTGAGGGSGGGGGRDACSNYIAPGTGVSIESGGQGNSAGKSYFCGCGSASGGGGAYSAGKDAQYDCGSGWSSNNIKGGIAWVPGGQPGFVGCETDIGNNQWCGTGGSGAGEVNGGPVQAEWRSGDAYSKGGSYQYCASDGLGGAGDGGGGSRGTCGENGGGGGYGNVWIAYDGGQRGQGGYSISSKDSRTNHVFRYSGTYTVNF